MTQRTTPPLRADHAGSFLRPKELPEPPGGVELRGGIAWTFPASPGKEVNMAPQFQAAKRELPVDTARDGRGGV